MDKEYWTFRDGKMITIPPIDKLCASLKEKFLRQEEENNRLREENKKLKEGIWKEEEISRLKTRCEELQKEANLGFPISEEENIKIKEWIKSHRSVYTGTIGGRYEYRFFPTGIGIIGEVIDTITNDKFTFREL